MSSGEGSPRFFLDSLLLKILLGAIIGLVLINLWYVGLNSDALSSFGFRQFDFKEEGNLFTWFRSMLLFLNALCAYTQVRRSWPGNRKYAVACLAVVLGFVTLSIDDFIQLHEFLEEVAKVALKAHGFLHGTSAVGLLLGAGLGVVVAAYLGFFYMRTAHRRNLWLMCCSVGFIGVGVLAELVYDYLNCPPRGVCFRWELVFDEGCSLMAILCFLAFQYREMSSA